MKKVWPIGGHYPPLSCVALFVLLQAEPLFVFIGSDPSDLLLSFRSLFFPLKAADSERCIHLDWTVFASNQTLANWKGNKKESWLKKIQSFQTNQAKIWLLEPSGLGSAIGFTSDLDDLTQFWTEGSNAEATKSFWFNGFSVDPNLKRRERQTDHLPIVKDSAPTGYYPDRCLMHKKKAKRQILRKKKHSDCVRPSRQKSKTAFYE